VIAMMQRDKTGEHKLVQRCALPLRNGEGLAGYHGPRSLSAQTAERLRVIELATG